MFGIFGWLGKALLSKSLFVPLQLAVSLALILAHISMLAFFLYAIVFIYNKYNEFLQLIADLSEGTELLAIALNIMQSMGIINAFNDVFSLFSPFIIGYLVYRSLLIVYHSFQATSNELFKVGVLVQQ